MPIANPDASTGINRHDAEQAYRDMFQSAHGLSTAGTQLINRLRQEIDDYAQDAEDNPRPNEEKLNVDPAARQQISVYVGGKQLASVGNQNEGNDFNNIDDSTANYLEKAFNQPVGTKSAELDRNVLYRINGQTVFEIKNGEVLKNILPNQKGQSTAVAGAIDLNQEVPGFSLGTESPAITEPSVEGESTPNKTTAVQMPPPLERLPKPPVITEQMTGETRSAMAQQQALGQQSSGQSSTADQSLAATPIAQSQSQQQSQKNAQSRPPTNQVPQVQSVPIVNQSDQTRQVNQAPQVIASQVEAELSQRYSRSPEAVASKIHDINTKIGEQQPDGSFSYDKGAHVRLKSQDAQNVAISKPDGTKLFEMKDGQVSTNKLSNRDIAQISGNHNRMQSGLKSEASNRSLNLQGPITDTKSRQTGSPAAQVGTKGLNEVSPKLHEIMSVVGRKGKFETENVAVQSKDSQNAKIMDKKTGETIFESKDGEVTTNALSSQGISSIDDLHASSKSYALSRDRSEFAALKQKTQDFSPEQSKAHKQGRTQSQATNKPGAAQGMKDKGMAKAAKYPARQKARKQKTRGQDLGIS